MLDLFKGTGTVGWVFGKAAADDFFPNRGEGCCASDAKLKPPRRDGGWCFVGDLAAYVSRVKGGLAGEEFVQGAAKSIHIVSDAGRFTRCLLRAHVGKCAGGIASDGDAHQGVLNAAGNAEVHDFEVALTVDEQVRWLQITMNDFGAAMCVSKTIDQLPYPVFHLVGFEDFVGLGNASFGKGLAVDVFHRDGSVLFILAEVVDFDDVRVCKIKTTPSFAFQFFDGRIVKTHGIGGEFEGDLTLQAFIVSEPHHTHAAAA